MPEGQSSAPVWSESDGITKHIIEGLINPITARSAGIYCGTDTRYTEYWSFLMAFWIEIRALAVLKEIQRTRVANVDKRMDELPEKILKASRGEGVKPEDIINEFRDLWKEMWEVTVGSQIFWQLKPIFQELTRKQIGMALPFLPDEPMPKKAEAEKAGEEKDAPLHGV